MASEGRSHEQQQKPRALVHFPPYEVKDNRSALRNFRGA
jgi:hypothetical protein